jgi:hypothetical protein
MTPKEAMRELCKQCCCTPVFNTKAVSGCKGNKAECGPCPLYSFRLTRISVKTLRLYCLYCMGGSRQAVSECTTDDCPCHPYRFGKNPAMAERKGNVESLLTHKLKACKEGNNG